MKLVVRLTHSRRLGRCGEISMCGYGSSVVLATAVAMIVCGRLLGQAPPVSQDLAHSYREVIQPLLQRYCHACHAADVTEADVDLESFTSLTEARRQPQVWQKVREMLDSQQMPPRDAEQPSDDQRDRLRTWVHEFLIGEARATAGDPGPVVLRRLSNAEYNYTIRDLTGVMSLDPTGEFPVDGAAGEGFTNTGIGQGMSPSLVSKYLDAARTVAAHAALYPRGIRFTPYRSRRDLTDDALASIRAFYARYTTDGGGSSVDLQGIKFDTNQGGLLPLEDYLAATVAKRAELLSGQTELKSVAHQRQLSVVYLGRLWRALNETDSPSLLLDPVRKQWRDANPDDVPALVRAISTWQRQLWKFNVVGHLGREGAPQSWLEPVTPITNRQEFRVKLPTPADGHDVVVQLSASEAGDGNDQDYVLWRDLRLEGNGQPPLNLRDLQGLQQRLNEWKRRILVRTTDYLNVAAAAGRDVDIVAYAKDFGVQSTVLRKWLDYLNVDVGGPVEVRGHFTDKILKGGNYDFINGWGTSATPSVSANSSDQEVRIPGIAKPHSLVMHPSPTEFAAIGWSSPIDGIVQLNATIADAHPECGNGVEWFVQHRTANKVTSIGRGDFETRGQAKLSTQTISVGKGELISLIVGPRQKNHGCDLTAIEFTIREAGGEKRVWDASRDTSDDILAGNPHADSHGNEGIWHFYHGAVDDVLAERPSDVTVPPNSLLARWQQEPNAQKRKALAQQIADLAVGPAPSGEQKTTPDGVLYDHLQSLAVPGDYGALIADVQPDSRFGTHPLGHHIDANHLVVRAPSTIEFRIPAELAVDRELVVMGMPDADHGHEATVRLEVSIDPKKDGVAAGPIICAADSQARARVEMAMAEFRELFPIALCYTRIVPVDEVVTAVLFHREDELLKHLMLSEQESAELDRLWDELLFISEEPLQAVVALEQIREFSTQDRQDLVGPWDQLKPVVQARAEAFQARVIETEPIHLQSVLEFADRAWRRKLANRERRELHSLYETLRASELPHESAIRLVITRVLTSPNFLYRREQQPAGPQASPVTDLELANRLSYFLWSSMPDEELRAVAEEGRLEDGELLVQTRRLLADPRIRRLAIHFACQWLHLRDFDRNDEKNEKLYPQFAELRGDMYEETVRFFENMFRYDGSILDIFDANHTFLNERLAKHYGIPGVAGVEWRRVEEIKSKGRGGLLGMATVLASQSGASRTSPILRGNWVSETLLGERLPRPPANVPQLSETVPTGLTARELIERHSSVPECAKCHSRIDPYGFALEQYDAIGRLRESVVDTKTTLLDGRTIEGLSGIRDYLVHDRRDAVVRQFCRKLLGYALGREIQLSDELLLREMQDKLESNGHRFSVAVEAIVTSRQFQDIRGQSFNP